MRHTFLTARSQPPASGSTFNTGGPHSPRAPPRPPGSPARSATTLYAQLSSTSPCCRWGPPWWGPSHRAAQRPRAACSGPSAQAQLAWGTHDQPGQRQHSPWQPQHFRCRAMARCAMARRACPCGMWPGRGPRSGPASPGLRRSALPVPRGRRPRAPARAVATQLAVALKP